MFKMFKPQRTEITDYITRVVVLSGDITYIVLASKDAEFQQWAKENHTDRWEQFFMRDLDSEIDDGYYIYRNPDHIWNKFKNYMTYEPTYKFHE